MSERAPEDFDAFYAARAEALVRLLYVRTGDLTRAQDCAQEAFIRAWLRWNKFQPDGDPVAWVRKVAWNLAVSDWRSTRRAHARDARQVASQSMATEDVLVPEVVEVRNALRRLPGAQQTVVVLHYYEGLSLPEISAVVGKPVGTIKSSLHRARTALRDHLDAGDNNPDTDQNNEPDSDPGPRPVNARSNEGQA